MTQGPRTGALGALVDEYERALGALAALLGTISDPAFERTRDPDTRDDDCRSVQTVVAHVTDSGYGYADMIRSALGADSTRPEPGLREQLLEHAIVHVLRHRRQIEAFLREPRVRGTDGA